MGMKSTESSKEINVMVKTLGNDIRNKDGNSAEGYNGGMTNRIKGDDRTKTDTEKISERNKKDIFREERVSTPEETQEETKEIRQHYDEVEFTQILIRGDGYCMINAVLTGIIQQGSSPLSLERVLSLLKPTFLKDISRYCEGITSDTDHDLLNL